MSEQIDRYVAAGYRSGLWAGGVVIRHNVPPVHAFNYAWWDEFRFGCSRDQIALPWALHRSGIHIATIDRDVLMDSEHFSFVFHAGFADHEPNVPFNDARMARINRRNELRRLCQ